MPASVAWNFQPNCFADFWWNAGFTIAPGGGPDYAGVEVQHMRPVLNANVFTVFFLHRIIVPVSSMPIASTTDRLAGITAKLYDSSSFMVQWWSVNDLSPFPFPLPGEFNILHYMLLLRPASF